MKLIEIDKPTYRKNLNKAIIAFVLSFAVLAVVYGAMLIHFFADAAIEGEAVNNFRFNLFGVLLALLTCAAVLNQYKHHIFLQEVYYVWQLKQLHNQIYRRLKKIKTAAENAEADAFIVLNFYYTSLQQVYLLDDNTLTISKVEQDLAQLREKWQAHHLTVTIEQFQPSLIKTFK